MSFPPGPRAPRLIQAARLTAEPYAWMLKRRERFGDIFSSHFPFFGHIVYVTDPELVKQVFSGSPEVFHAGEANATVLGDALGEHSLLTLDEGRHLSQRKLLLPPFHGESVRRYAEVMAEVAAAKIDTWPVGQPFALRPRMQEITLDVILRAVFGVRDGERMDLFRERIPPLGELSNPLDWLPLMQRDLGGLSTAARFRKALAKVDELIYAEIADRRAALAANGDGTRDDVLSLLLPARHEDGSAMTDVELRDQLMTLLTAGHETTATGLSWAFERLLRNPHVLEALLGSLDDDEYLDAVVKETLRVRPVVADVARVLKKPVVLAGYPLPAGTLVLPGITAVHMRPGPLPRAARVPARALSRRRRRVLLVDPVRGRRATLHRRLVRPGGDARRDPRGAAAGHAARRLGAARAPEDPARDGGPGARLPRRSSRRGSSLAPPPSEPGELEQVGGRTAEVV